MSTNNLSALNEILFAQLRRLNSELTDEQLKHEKERAISIINVSREITASARLRLDAVVAVHEYQLTDGKKQLGFTE